MGRDPIQPTTPTVPTETTLAPRAPGLSGAATEALWRVYDATSEWIRFADAKAGAILTADALLLATAVLELLKRNQEALPKCHLAMGGRRLRRPQQRGPDRLGDLLPGMHRPADVLLGRGEVAPVLRAHRRPPRRGCLQDRGRRPGPPGGVLRCHQPAGVGQCPDCPHQVSTDCRGGLDARPGPALRPDRHGRSAGVTTQGGHLRW